MRKILLKIGVSALFLALSLAAGWFIGVRWNVPRPATLSSQIILDRIQDRQFLVTKTLFFEEEVTETLQDPGGFKGFFLGDEFTAASLVRVDIGVDFNSMRAEMIEVNPANRSVRVALPPAAILDTSLYGDLGITTRRGVLANLKDLFSGDDSADYNRAVSRLKEQALAAARERREIFAAAREDAAGLVRLIVEAAGLDYSVIIVSDSAESA